MNQNTRNFQNAAFEEIFETLSRQIPGMVLSGIVITYIITAGLSVYFIPLPMGISVPAAAAVQFGRFAVVFMDFLNPTGVRSKWPPIVASLATIFALVELYFSLHDISEVNQWTMNRYWSVYIFSSMVIAFGYILELNFIAKGAEAFGMVTRRIFEQRNTLQIPFEVVNTNSNIAPAIIAEAKRPEVLRELRERQSKPAKSEQDVHFAIRKEEAKIRAYRWKLENGTGRLETNKAGIERATKEIERLQAL